ncbi:MAG: hypothetical protein EXQ50_07860 [Acidobacteria bacterium]|nr:hypothetical protein [Acidobacteriota bacterium]
MTASPSHGNRQRPARKRGSKVAFDPRTLMERAIEVMRKSVAEARTDEKASPSVGVVLWMPDGTVETACRGELRDGDHAEYTLLERKNRHSRLEGAVLFATLEPCAPGARQHPKLGCAERIVLARIKQVWIGIEDPDPTVDRKGIKSLQDNGVAVHMFDRELQETIKVANKEFIAQALERAAAARLVKKPKRITLSPLEGRIANVNTNDLSTEALAQYREIAKIDEAVGSPDFNRRLVQQGLLKQDDGHWAPTGFGLLLFGARSRGRSCPKPACWARFISPKGMKSQGTSTVPRFLRRVWRCSGSGTSSPIRSTALPRDGERLRSLCLNSHVRAS